MLPDLIADEQRSQPRRLLYRFDDDVPFAYARGTDLIRCRDQTLWAHLSDGRLLSARSGQPLAYQTGSVFYDAITHQPLYYKRSSDLALPYAPVR